MYLQEEESPYLTQTELARLWKIKPRTLEGWRFRNVGPKYYRFGRSIRYHLDDIEEFERSESSPGFRGETS